MKILIFGLPNSGKTTLARKLQEELKWSWFNADEVRKQFNDWDFSPEGRLRQADRMKKLCSQYKFSIADFVAPTKEIRDIFNPDFTIWMNTIQESPYEDTNKVFEIPTLDEVDIIISSFDYDLEKILNKIKGKI